jgi:hypothetical protein
VVATFNVVAQEQPLRWLDSFFLANGSVTSWVLLHPRVDGVVVARQQWRHVTQRSVGVLEEELLGYIESANIPNSLCRVYICTYRRQSPRSKSRLSSRHQPSAVSRGEHRCRSEL